MEEAKEINNGKPIMKALLLLLSAFWFSGDLLADTLPAQLHTFIDTQLASQANQLKTTLSISTPKNRWPSCISPQFSLLATGRYWGKVTISAYCGQQRYFIQAEIQIVGHYLIAAKKISAGNILTTADIQTTTGRLDRLPANTLTKESDVVGAISLRNIRPGEPLNRAMLRRSWVIEAGQNVQVVMQGPGFIIKGGGKALGNAAAEDNVRVRLVSGQVLTGIASRNGQILLML